MGENAEEGKPRRNISSAKRNKGQKECLIIQGDHPRNSNDNVILHECTGQLGGEKYLRESYYHRIKCSATNSLATLMRK